MHQSPLKELGGPRREKYPAAAMSDDEPAGRRVKRGAEVKSRRFLDRDESPRGSRGRHPNPRG